MGYDAIVSDADLAAIDAAVPVNLHRWGIADTAEVKLLNHSENTTYLIRQGDQRFILRVHRLGYHTPRAITAELDWVQSIGSDTPIRTAAPIVGVDNMLIQPFPTAQQGERHSVLFEFLEGEEPSEEHDLVASFEQLGIITALLHEHSKRWLAQREAPERPVWDLEGTLGSRPIWGEWRKGIGVDADTAAQLGRGVDKIRDRLEAFGTGSDRFGLIHADLRLANLLIHGGAVSVIDFDDCGLGWFMYDLGSALSFIEHRDYVPSLIDAWVKGYNQVRQLTEEEVAMIPTFIMLRRILLVAWLGSHSETEIAREIGARFTPQTVELVNRYLDDRLFT